MTAITTVNEILKEDYGPDGIANTAYIDNPGFGMLKKHKLTGKYYDFPVQYGYASNRSHLDTTALGKTNTTNYVNFNVPTVADYDAKDIQKKILDEAVNPNTFVELLRNVSDSVIQALANNCGSDFFANRGAAIGRIGSGQATPTVTLLDVSDITKFYVGQTLAVSLNDGLSGALRAGTVAVTAIDSAAGTVTASGNWTAGIAAAVANDFIFPAGDFGIGRAGLADWCPDLTTNLGTAFYNVTRSVSASQLAGTRLSVTGLPISQAIRQVAALAGRTEGKPDTCFMSWIVYNDLVTERDLKVLESVERKASAGKGEMTTIGFSGIKIAGARGSIDIFPDRSCNDSHFYLCKIADGLIVHSQDAPVKIDDEDGNILARNLTSFSYDIRGASFMNYVWSKPLNLAVGVF